MDIAWYTSLVAIIFQQQIYPRRGVAYLFHIWPKKPVFGRCSFMLCLLATEMGSSLRFWALRLSNHPLDACDCAWLKRERKSEEERAWMEELGG
jgi:hypothetical protein